MEPACRPGLFGYDDAIVRRILMTIATHEQSNLLNLSTLSETIDPDTLNQVTQGAGVTGSTFPYHGYRVRIDGDSYIDVTPGE